VLNDQNESLYSNSQCGDSKPTVETQSQPNNTITWINADQSDLPNINRHENFTSQEWIHVMSENFLPNRHYYFDGDDLLSCPNTTQPSAVLSDPHASSPGVEEFTSYISCPSPDIDELSHSSSSSSSEDDQTEAWWISMAGQDDEEPLGKMALARQQKCKSDKKHEKHHQNQLKVRQSFEQRDVEIELSIRVDCGSLHGCGLHILQEHLALVGRRTPMEVLKSRAIEFGINPKAICYMELWALARVFNVRCIAWIRGVDELHGVSMPTPGAISVMLAYGDGRHWWLVLPRYQFTPELAPEIYGRNSVNMDIPYPKDRLNEELMRARNGDRDGGFNFHITARRYYEYQAEHNGDFGRWWNSLTTGEQNIVIQRLINKTLQPQFSYVDSCPEFLEIKIPEPMTSVNPEELTPIDTIVGPRFPSNMFFPLNSKVEGDNGFNAPLAAPNADAKLIPHGLDEEEEEVEIITPPGKEDYTLLPAEHSKKLLMERLRDNNLLKSSLPSTQEESTTTISARNLLKLAEEQAAQPDPEAPKPPVRRNVDAVQLRYHGESELAENVRVAMERAIPFDHQHPVPQFLNKIFRIFKRMVGGFVRTIYKVLTYPLPLIQFNRQTKEIAVVWPGRERVLYSRFKGAMDALVVSMKAAFMVQTISISPVLGVMTSFATFLHSFYHPTVYEVEDKPLVIELPENETFRNMKLVRATVPLTPRIKTIRKVYFGFVSVIDYLVYSESIVSELAGPTVMITKPGQAEQELESRANTEINNSAHIEHNKQFAMYLLDRHGIDIYADTKTIGVWAKLARPSGGKRLGGRVSAPLYTFGYVSSDSYNEFSSNANHDVRGDTAFRTEGGMGESIPLYVNNGGASPYGANPAPCPYDNGNLIHGFRHRNARELAGAQGPFREILSEWNRYQLSKCLFPLDPVLEEDVEQWLARTHYKGTRKKQLRVAYGRIKSVFGFNREHFISKTFGKKERLDQGIFDEFGFEPSKGRGKTLYKILRLIQNLSDEFKVIFGPLTKMCEDQVFSLSVFIKRIAVHLRAQYLNELFRNCSGFLCSDFESFENMFNAIFMSCIEIPFFDYMFQRLLLYPILLLYVELACMGNNELSIDFGSERITCILRALRLSGIMWTSLINSWANFVLQTLVSYLSQVRQRNTIEGDDNESGALQVFSQPVTELVYMLLGCTAKIIKTPTYNTESFCGLIFHPDDLRNIPDIMYTVQNMGWCPARYRPGNRSRNALMVVTKSQALSCLYSNAGAPIVQSMASAFCRVLAGIEVDWELVPYNWWTQFLYDQIQKYGAVRKEVGWASRVLVETTQGILISDQLELERWFDSWTTLQPMDHWIIDKYTSGISRDYLARHGTDVFYRRLNRALPSFTISPGVKRLREYETMVVMDIISQKFLARCENNFRTELVDGRRCSTFRARPKHSFCYRDIVTSGDKWIRGWIFDCERNHRGLSKLTAREIEKLQYFSDTYKALCEGSASCYQFLEPKRGDESNSPNPSDVVPDIEEGDDH